MTHMDDVVEDGGVDVTFTGDVLVNCHCGLWSPHNPVLAVHLLQCVRELHLHPTQGRPGVRQGQTHSVDHS